MATTMDFITASGNVDLYKVQELMLRTVNEDMAMSKRDTLANAALGLCGELGEVLEIYEFRFGGSPPTNLKLELGDMCWYLFLLCKTLNLVPNAVFKGADAAKHYGNPGYARYELTRLVLTLADKIKKILYHSEVNSDAWQGKLSDDQIVIIYELTGGIGALVEWLALAEGISLAEVFQANIEKLQKRYKGGKFQVALQGAKLDEVAE